MQYLKIVIYGPLKCKNILFRVFEASIYYAYDKKEKKLYVKTSTGNYEISLDDYYAKEEARKLAERQAQLKHFVPNKCKSAESARCNKCRALWVSIDSTNGLDIADFLLMTETPQMALQRLIKQQPPLQHLIDCIGLVLVEES